MATYPKGQLWNPLRQTFCRLLDFPDHYSWEAIYEEVKLIKAEKRCRAALELSARTALMCLRSDPDEMQINNARKALRLALDIVDDTAADTGETALQSPDEK